MDKYRIEKEFLVFKDKVKLNFVVLKYINNWVVINSFDTYEEAENYITKR